MKLFCAFAILFLPLTLRAQDKEIITRGDSLIIRDENIASNPFNFGRDPLAKLKAMPNLSRPSMQLNPTPNRHVDNQVDTKEGMAKTFYSIAKSKPIGLRQNMGYKLG